VNSLPSALGRREHESLKRVLPDARKYLVGHVLLSPLLAVNGVMRASRRGYRRLMWRRLLQTDPVANTDELLIVAGGLGEARVAIRLKELLEQSRGARCSILVQSDETLPLSTDQTPLCAAPFNNPFSVWRCIQKRRPQAVWVVEFWDNHHMKIATARKGIPTLVVNVPITELGISQGIAKPQNHWRFGLVGLYAAQSDEHRARMLSLGVESDRVAVTGAIGSWLPDRVPERAASAKGWRERLKLEPSTSPIVVAGCTYREDEAVVLDAFKRLKTTKPSSLLILAPRRLARLAEVLASVESSGLQASLLSDATVGSDVIVVDGYGELSELYSVADFAFIGGAFSEGIGGHTPAEAASWNVPTAIGPDCFHHTSLVERLRAEGRLRVVASSDELLESWTKPLATPDRTAVLTEPLSQQMALELYDYTLRESCRN